VQPLPCQNTIQLSQAQKTSNINSQLNDHCQETSELQRIPSISRTINAAPMNTESNKVQTFESEAQRIQGA